MKRKNTWLTLTVLALVSLSVLRVLGGNPYWPPLKHSAEYRKANMLFLQFQDALAAEQWQQALSLCSDRVRAKAVEWPSPEAFLKETIPVDLLLAKDFAYWMGKVGSNANFYGLLVPLTEPEAKPLIQWFWAITATNQTWVVDYPPVKLEEYIARKKAAIQARENETEQIRTSLLPRLKDVKTHLVPVSQRFVIGAPMLFQVELENTGKAAVDYKDGGVAHSPLAVFDDKGNALAYKQTPAQITARQGQVAPGASVVLADRVDLNSYYATIKPGKYVVQFNGTELVIGQRIRMIHGWSWDPGPFGEEKDEGGFDFFGLTNRMPSEPIKIEVVVGRKP
jgi:hypothetical protein